MKVIQAKICLLGDFAVGKTSLVRRVVEGRFDDRYLSTIGVQISRKVLLRQGTTLSLIMWDLAGGDTFAQAQRSYLSGARGALIVCDLTRRDTLERLSQYVDSFQKANPGAVIVFAANKADLTEAREISEDDLREASKDREGFFLTSAKTGAGVEEALSTLAWEVEARYGLRSTP